MWRSSAFRKSAPRRAEAPWEPSVVEARISVRLQVERTTPSSTRPPWLSCWSRARASSSLTEYCSRTATGAVRWDIPTRTRSSIACIVQSREWNEASGTRAEATRAPSRSVRPPTAAQLARLAVIPGMRLEKAISPKWKQIANMLSTNESV